MATNVAVIQFPGTNCEMDVVEAVRSLGADAEIFFHDSADLGNADAVIISGGFAHGDYLRPGAIARFSPVMDATVSLAKSGAPVVGICNGFQVLAESHLLPGALQKNAGLKFRCGTATLRVETNNSCITNQLEVGQELQIPINHFEGNYTCSAEVLEELQAEDRIVLRYVENPNGSVDDIAGICNAERNVVGLMPHPERACHPLLGSIDGVAVLASVLAAAGATVG